jgi:hypothetical protein
MGARATLFRVNLACLHAPTTSDNVHSIMAGIAGRPTFAELHPKPKKKKTVKRMRRKSS